MYTIMTVYSGWNSEMQVAKCYNNYTVIDITVLNQLYMYLDIARQVNILLSKGAWPCNYNHDKSNYWKFVESFSECIHRLHVQVVSGLIKNEKIWPVKKFSKNCKHQAKQLCNMYTYTLYSVYYSAS